MKTAKSSKAKTATPAKATSTEATSKAKTVNAAPAPAPASIASVPAPVKASPRKTRTAPTAGAKAAEAPTLNGTTTAPREITTDLIAERAYIIWEQQGRPQGHDLANWLLAESQLKQEQVLTA